MKTDVDLMALLKEGAETIQRTFKDPDDDWVPVLMVRTGDKINVCLLEITDDKEVASYTIMQVIRQCEADEAALIASSWFVRRDKVDSLDKPVRLQPDRKEALVISHVTKDMTHVVTADINRHDGKPPTLGEWSEQVSGLDVDGLFVDAMRLGIG